MIIDDDENIREILRMMLKDFTILKASNAVEGIRIFAKERPAIVLIDISKPRIDGVEATREIMKINPRAKVCLPFHVLEGRNCLVQVEKD